MPSRNSWIVMFGLALLLHRAHPDSWWGWLLGMLAIALVGTIVTIRGKTIQVEEGRDVVEAPRDD